jgi:phosphatidylglycerophosphatase A
MGIVISRPARVTGGSAEPRFIPGVGVYHPGNGNSSTDLPPIPIEWIIAPLNTTVAQCPSPAATLRTFGVTNAVVAVLAIVMGCRPIVHKLTRGILGTRGGNTVKWMWIVSLSLQLLANVFVSLLIKHTPGYGHLSMLNIFALYSARPRVSLPVLALLRVLMGVNLRKLRKSEKHPDEIEFIYADSYITTALAELCMQIFAAIFIGVTWNRFPNKPVKDYMNSLYKIMEALPGITFFCIGAVVPFYQRNGEAIPRESRNPQGQLVRSYQNVWAHRMAIVFIACFFIGFSFGSQWVYFATFLKLPGSLYVSTMC